MSKIPFELPQSFSIVCKTYSAGNSSSSNNLSVTCDQEGGKQQQEETLGREHRHGLETLRR